MIDIHMDVEVSEEDTSGERREKEEKKNDIS